MNRRELDGAAALVRTELRAQVRYVLGDTRRALATLLMLVGLPLWIGASSFDGAVSFGRSLSRGTVPLGAAGATFTGLALAAGYIGGAGGFNQRRVGNVGPLVRTSLAPTAVSLGRMAHRVTESLALVIPAAALLLLGVAVGAGGVLVPVVVFLVALPVFVAGYAVGRVVGDCFRWINERLAVSIWVKALGVLALTAVFFLGTQLFVTGGASESAVGVPAFLPGRPMQAYASVAFAPLGGRPTALGALTAVVVLLLGPVATVTAVRLETYLLVRDIGSDETARASGTSGVPRLFRAWPSLRIAWRYLLRTRRDPRMLAHLGPLLFGGLAMVGTVIQNPSSLLLIGPAAAVVGGATFAGSAYCLNPLGDDVDQLPLLLTSTESVGVLLRGRMLAGIVPGLALAVGVGGPLALLEWPPLYALGQSLLAVVLATTGAGVALGLGALVPKFERHQTMGVERAHPSTTAVLGFFLGVLIVGGGGILLLLWTLGDGSLAAAVLAWPIYLGLLAALGLVGYRYAVRKFDALTLDDI